MIVLNGSSQYSYIPYNSSIQPTSAITIMAWIIADNFNNTYAVVSKPYRTTGWSGPYMTYKLSVTGGGSVGYEVTIGGSVKGTWTAGGTLSTATLYHLCMIYNGSTLKLYRNGVEISSSNVSGSLDYNENTDLCLGMRSTYSAGEYFPGKIYDIRIYNRAISTTELGIISKHSGNDNIVNGLVLRNPFTSSVIDVSPYANHGTAVGSPTYVSGLFKNTKRMVTN